jgi:hypothetical protein
MLALVFHQRQHLLGTIVAWTSTTTSRVENSASVGILCQFFPSSATTALIACCSSTIRATISKVDPQRVTTSLILCCSRPSSSCFCLRSRVFFQLRWHSPTSEWHLPIAIQAFFYPQIKIVSKRADLNSIEDPEGRDNIWFTVCGSCK